MIKEPQIAFNKLKDDNPNQEKCSNDHFFSIGSYKKFWEHQRKMLRTYHEASPSGTGLAQMHTELMDKLLRQLWKNVKASYLIKSENAWPYSLCLAALSEYGRSELCPYSDVDLLLLYPEKMPSHSLTLFLDIFNDEVIHLLWDLKITVKHAHRTINYSITDARRDFKIKNGQLDARIICGSKNLFEDFQEKYDFFLKNESLDDFEKQCLENKHARHQKCDFTVFLQEPDIKNGVGGLQDYQTILWLGRARLGAPTIEAIECQKILTNKECIQLRKSYNFLLKVRNELHFQNNEGSNLLNLENQEKIALALGYQQKSTTTHTEEFMRNYYEETKSIYEISKTFEERLKQKKQKKQKRVWLKSLLKKNLKAGRSIHSKKYIDGFIITNNQLTYELKEIFLEDPVRIIRVFRYAQQYHVELDNKLKSLIQKSTYLINEEIINHPSANRSFCSIFQSIGEVYPILMLMYELGVLENFLPEFKKITHLIQYEHYHRYTVDIHTLNAIQALDNIFQYKNEKNKCYYKAIKNTPRPWLLYLILLLHDLGKATGINNTTEMGVIIAKPILERLKIELTQQEYILFVIQNSFQMMNFWQRFDIDSPQAPETFGLFIKNTEILNYCYVQTYCDLIATKSGIWNSHKEMLHTKLFEKTFEFLIKNESYNKHQINNKKDFYKKSIYKYYPKIMRAQVEEMLNLYPDNYFMLNSPEEFDFHTQLIDKAKKHINKSNYNESLMPIIHWQYDINRCLTVITVITWNKTNFLTTLAGALASCGFNILEEKGFTRSDQIEILVFNITDSRNSNFLNEHLRIKFYKSLKEILFNNQDPMTTIISQIKKHGSKPRESKTLQVDVRQEFLDKKTLIKIQSNDQIGLFYQFSKIISNHEFNILFSRVSTECGETTSTFFIQKNNIHEITTIKKLLLLREDLNNILLNLKTKSNTNQ